MSLFKRKKQQLNLEGMDLSQLLFAADTQPDPRLAYQALVAAQVLAPDSLEVQRRLLLHGRLHERDPKKMDMSVIKCYLLHAFEHPEDHTPAAQKEMARALFDDAQLARCLALADDPPAFLQDYLLDLAREYMRIFIAPDNRHAPRVFGISLRANLQRYLAVPAADIIKNALSSPYLGTDEGILLAKAFYRAFYDHAQGDVKALDSLLGAEIRALLR